MLVEGPMVEPIASPITSPVASPGAKLPAQTLNMYEKEVARLREQHGDLQLKIQQLEHHRKEHRLQQQQLQLGQALPSPSESSAMPYSPYSMTSVSSVGKRSHKRRHRDGRGGTSSGVEDSEASPGAPLDVGDISRLAAQLRTALAQANAKRQLTQHHLNVFEEDAEREYETLRGELDSARDVLDALEREGHVLEVKGKAAAAEWAKNELDLKENSRLPLAAPDMRLTHELLDDLRIVTDERDLSIEDSRRLQAELREARERLEAESRNHTSPDLAVLEEALRGTGIDAAAVDAVGVDAVENMLRTEVAALQTSLDFYSRTREREATAEHRAAEHQENAMKLRQQAYREEAATLGEAEQRVRMGHACLADALSFAAPQADGAGEAELDAKLKLLARREDTCKALLEATIPLEKLVDQLCSLRAAAGQKTAELERALMPKRITTEAAALTAKRAGKHGAEAIVCCLAQLCGSARIAFLLLDNNHNGRISMCEFDNSLRNKLSLDFEAISNMKLRPLFRQFDQQKRGVLALEDLAKCCPEVWEEYGQSTEALGERGGNGALAYLAACRVEDQAIIAARSAARGAGKNSTSAIEAACRRLLLAARTTLKGGSQQIVDGGGGRFRMAYALDRERQFMTILAISNQTYPERLAYRCIRELLGTIHGQCAGSAKSSPGMLDRELGPSVQALLERYEASAEPGTTATNGRASPPRA